MTKLQISGETGESITYKQILEDSVKVAIALQKLGLQKGDVVGLSCENRFEFPAAALGTIFAGGILSTLNITYSTGEFHFPQHRYAMVAMIYINNNIFLISRGVDTFITHNQTKICICLTYYCLQFTRKLPRSAI